jgi:hypothetical protein
MMARCLLIIVFVLLGACPVQASSLSASAPAAGAQKPEPPVHGKQRQPAAPGDLSGHPEDKQIVKMLDLLDSMELLKDVELLKDLDLLVKEN